MSSSLRGINDQTGSTANESPEIVLSSLESGVWSDVPSKKPVIHVSMLGRIKPLKRQRQRKSSKASSKRKSPVLAEKKSSKARESKNSRYRLSKLTENTVKTHLELSYRSRSKNIAISWNLFDPELINCRESFKKLIQRQYSLISQSEAKSVEIKSKKCSKGWKIWYCDKL